LVAVPDYIPDSLRADATEDVDALDIDTWTRDKINQIIVSRVRDGIAGNSTRDNLLVELDLQLEGRLQGDGKPRWKGACSLNHPISRKVFLQTLAMVTQSQRRDPKVTVDAANPDKEENANLLEKWLANKSVKYKLNDYLYDVAYIAGRDPTAILYGGWNERIRMRYSARYHELDDDYEPKKGVLPVRSEDRLERTPYMKVAGEYEPVVEEAGCEFRAIDCTDFYLIPSDAQSIKHALGTAERMLLTEDQLIDGIKDFGYDEEAITRLIQQGPTHGFTSNGNDLREIRNQYDGTSNGIGIARDGFYECFLTYTRTPRHDGMELLDVPDELLQSDLQAMVCPSRETVFQLMRSPYTKRPYIDFSMLRVPGRFLGRGLMQLIYQEQEELTASLQFMIDSWNMEASPALFASPEWIEEYSAWKVYPGAVVPKPIGSTLEPIEWTRGALQGLELLEYVEGSAMGVASAEGYGSFQPKVRNEKETENVMGAADVKFDLILYNMMTPVAELMLWIVSLHAQFDDALSDVLKMDGEQKTVTPETLRGEYIMTPTATSSSASPQARLAIDQAVIQAVQQYFAGMAQTPPQFLPMLWHAYRNLLQGMMIKQPESFLGPQPQPPPPTPQGAIQIPTLVQAMTQQGIQPQVIQAILQQGQGINPAAGASGALAQGGGQQ
jgi:hypothetical protein